MSPLSPFSWRAALYTLGHPGPPPPALLGTAFVLLALCLATVAVLLWLGDAWHNEPHHFFREHQIGTYLSFANLVATGGVSALIARRLRPAPSTRFWWWMAAVLVWTGCDDLFLIHEDIDRVIHALLGLDPNDPITDHIDDLIVAGYGVAALALAWVHRVHLASFPWMVLFLAMAFGLFAALVVLEFTHLPRATEEVVKVVGGTLTLVGFLAAWLDTRASGGRR
jgi:hypothetical protein